MCKMSSYIGPEPESWEELRDDLLPGANVLILCDSSTYHKVARRAEEAGHEVRDCLTVITYDRTLKVLWTIEPLEDTFVGNALLHGVSGLNIAGSRIGTSKRAPGGLSRAIGGVALSGSVDGSFRTETGEEDGHNPNIGRYPTNLILMHHPECEGDCVASCPVALLDAQSGERRSSGH
jgi:hypothetical protein